MTNPDAQNLAPTPTPISPFQAALMGANTAAPAPFRRPPWYRRLFTRQWSDGQFVEVVSFLVRHPGRDWEPTRGALYRQTSKHTGDLRYWIRHSAGDMSIDASAWEQGRHLVFTSTIWVPV